MATMVKCKLIGGATVLVNADLVRTGAEGTYQQHTILTLDFDKEHSVVVVGTMDAFTEAASMARAR
ncbi:hypothetical protein [Ferrovibrio terrae]|uniref:hypothetical protein n=1 Tax=Ferrovibrio terrae TaxID=2594003 RepID=UPI0031378727